MAEKCIQAEKDYKKGMKYKEIAEKYNVSINTVKSWKQRHGWVRNKGAPKQKSMHTKKKGAPKGNINAKGNPGNRNASAPKGNSNAVTHGLFAKYLPQETLDIVNEIDSITPLDILWMNIKMQFAQIMRSQQIMHVEDKDDLTRILKKKKDGDTFTEKEWEIQLAWDKQANFLNSQSRAMGELRSMLKQFYELANADDDRLLEVQRMEASIEKTKKETEFVVERTKLIQGEKKDTSLLEVLIDTVTEDE
jgi:uncharacterized protein YjcR